MNERVILMWPAVSKRLESTGLWCHPLSPIV